MRTLLTNPSERARINEAAWKGDPVLTVAAEQNKLKVARVLLSAGRASADTLSAHTGRTAFTPRRRQETSRWHGCCWRRVARASAASSHALTMATALHEAAASGSGGTVHLDATVGLLPRDTAITRRDSNGRTLMAAAHGRHGGCWPLLRAAGAGTVEVEGEGVVQIWRAT